MNKTECFYCHKNNVFFVGITDSEGDDENESCENWFCPDCGQFYLANCHDDEGHYPGDDDENNPADFSAGWEP